ncbi:MAG: hypothetical protein AAFQ43_04655 [Bacteroidota bacterium]
MSKTQSRRDRSQRTRARRDQTTRAEASPARLCPSCGTEYEAHIDACADCAAPLFVPVEAPRPLAPEANLWEALDTASPLHARFTSAALHEAEIPFEVRETTTLAERLCSVLVAEEDAPEAERIVHAVQAGFPHQTPAEAVAAARTLPLPEAPRLLDESPYTEAEQAEIDAEEAEWDALPDLAPEASGGSAWSLGDWGAVVSGAGWVLWFFAVWMVLGTPIDDMGAWSMALVLALSGTAVRAHGRALTRRWREDEQT